MKKPGRPAFLLALCFILSACGPAQQPSEPQQPSREEEEVSLPERFSMPQSAGVDWNDAPADGAGTGEIAPEATAFPSYTYAVSEYYELADGQYSTVPDENGVVLSQKSIKITGLRNQILQNRLNDLIETQVQELSSAEPSVDAAALSGMAAENGAEKAYVSRQVRVSAQVSGRVLSLCFTRDDTLQLLDARGLSISVETVPVLAQERSQYMFDMYDGRQLKLCDLFFENAPYVQAVDEALSGQLEELKEQGLLKRAFCGLPQDYPYISAEEGVISVWFPADNPYTASEQVFSAGPEVLYTMCSVLYEDPSAFLTEQVRIERFALQRRVSVSAHVFAPAAASGEETLYSPRLNGGAEPSVLAAINAGLDAIEARYTVPDYLPPEMLPQWEARSSSSVYVTYHALSSYFCVQYITVISGESGSVSYSEYATFDLVSGRRLSAADLLVPSEELTQLLQEKGIVQPLEELTNVMVGYGFDVILPGTNTAEGSVYIPAQHFRFGGVEGGGAQ